MTNNNFERFQPIVAAAAAAVFAVAGLAGCSAADAAGARDAADASLAVTAVPAAMSEVADAIDVGGLVQARATASISARVLAPIRDIRVRPGDHVRRGQTLAVLDAGDLAAADRASRAAAVAAEEGAQAAAAELHAAEAGLVLARASHARIAGLEAARSATAQELDEAVTALRTAEARVAAASAHAAQATSAVESARAASDQAGAIAAFATIAAPFDGTVTATIAEAGDMASPGAPLLRLEDTRAFRLEVRVDESRIGGIETGRPVPVLLGNESSTVTGTVVEVSRTVDADARAFLVKIALPAAAGLRSGQFGRARFSGAPRRALIVPPTATVRHGQLTSVFVADQGRARLRLVNVSGSEVLAGLAESELVIVSPPTGLVDGRRITVGGR